MLSRQTCHYDKNYCHNGTFDEMTITFSAIPGDLTSGTEIARSITSMK